MDVVKPNRRRFVAAVNRPEPGLVARQMEATALAYKTLGSVEAARTFLNEIDVDLGGRPIDVAGGGVEGLRIVVDALRIRAEGTLAIGHVELFP